MLFLLNIIILVLCTKAMFQKMNLDQASDIAGEGVHLNF
jgi:hypothetical protein